MPLFDTEYVKKTVRLADLKYSYRNASCLSDSWVSCSSYRDKAAGNFKQSLTYRDSVYSV